MSFSNGWVFYTKKTQEYINTPQYAYRLHAKAETEYRYLVGEEGAFDEGDLICFYLLVNATDGVIQEASYQVFGEPILIALSEALCELVINKNYLQASRIGADLLEKKLRDVPYQQAISKEDWGLINKVLSAMFEALEGCEDIEIHDPYVHSPLSEGDLSSNSSNHSQYWQAYSFEEKLEVIKKVIKEEITPYVALDEGGVEVKDLINDKEVIILYQGACTSCFSAMGATLNAIDQILKQKVHPEIFVTPDTSVLKF